MRKCEKIGGGGFGKGEYTGKANTEQANTEKAKRKKDGKCIAKSLRQYMI